MKVFKLKLNGHGPSLILKENELNAAIEEFKGLAEGDFFEVHCVEMEEQKIKELPEHVGW
jgi:hypothetical protein